MSLVFPGIPSIMAGLRATAAASGLDQGSVQAHIRIALLETPVEDVGSFFPKTSPLPVV